MRQAANFAINKKAIAENGGRHCAIARGPTRQRLLGLNEALSHILTIQPRPKLS